MSTSSRWWCILALVSLVASVPSPTLRGQDLEDRDRWNVDDGDWSNDENWVDSSGETSGAPSPTELDRWAQIDNGGTVRVTDEITTSGLTLSDGLLDIQSGASLEIALIDDPFSVGQTVIGGNGTLRIADNASFKALSATNGGTIELASPTSSFQLSGDLSQQGNVRLNITPEGTPQLEVAGDVRLGGRVFANFSNVTPQFGDSYPFLEGAQSVTDRGTKIVASEGVELASGLELQLSTTANGAAITVGNLPVLRLDRTSGAASIANVVGGPLSLKSYSISSPRGLLNVEQWSSLKDQGDNNWTEANPRPQQLTELNLTGELTLDLNESVSLGNAYNGGATHPRDENVTIQFSTPDGRIFDGLVEYTGPVNDLVLRVDPSTGAAEISHRSAFLGPLDVTGYSILSASGGLLVEGWNSFVDSGAAGEGWREASPTPTAIAELNLEGSNIFDNGTVIPLGNIIEPGGATDLVFQFSTVEGESLFVGTVEFGDLGPVRIPGDINGNGTVDFADFLILSNNFGMAGGAAEGDLDDDGNIAFADFLILSNNFGRSTAAVAAVSEPATGWMLLMSVLGMLTAVRRRSRRGRVVLLGGLVVCLLSLSSDTGVAQRFDARLIRIDPAGSNALIDTTVEARGIADGTVDDVIIAEEEFSTVVAIDFGGGGGNFPINNPYPNDVNNDSMNDFLVQVTGTVEIPQGDWTIGFGSDDGGLLRIPAISFGETFNENGINLEDGDGEIFYNAPRGHAWTTGQFSVPAGGIRSDFEALFYERGGGDSLEVAIVSGFSANNSGSEIATSWTLLEDGALGWKVLDLQRTPGDFNADGNIDLTDFQLLADNFGTGTTFEQGDNNRDGRIDLKDFVAFVEAFNSQAAGAAAVPEPCGSILFGWVALLLLSQRRSSSRSHV